VQASEPVAHRATAGKASGSFLPWQSRPLGLLKQSFENLPSRLPIKAAVAVCGAGHTPAFGFLSSSLRSFRAFGPRQHGLRQH
jgi:hypothetical protein